MLAPRRFLPSISSLRALEALDRLGSASAVAQELSLTQSAVSRQLQVLERQVGTQLIVRENKRLSVTPAAQEYAESVRQALQQIAQSTLRVQVAPLGGTLNLAILPTFGMRWLVPRLPEFAKAHPEVTVNMTTRLHQFSFASEAFDAALHYGDSDWPDADSLLLRHEQVLPVCAPALLSDQRPATPADLKRMPLLHIQTRPEAWKEWFETHAVSADRSFEGTMYDQFSTITQAALHGLGVALMPDYLIEQDLAAGRLVALHPVAMETKSAYYLVWPRKKPESHSLRLFRDWLATQAQPEDTLPR